MAIECPKCSGNFLVKSEPVEQTVACPFCGNPVLVPALKTPASSPSSPPATQDEDYAGLYINLDRSVARRDRLESQLKQYNLSNRYRRLAAVDGRTVDRGPSTLSGAEIGCFLSHYEAVRQNLGSRSHLHILEDDVLLCGRTRPVLQSSIRSGAFDHYDVVFTDVFLTLDIPQLRQVKRLFEETVQRYGPVNSPAFNGFSIIDLRYMSYAAMTSYVVNRDSLANLCDLYAAEIKEGFRLPVDILVRDLVREGKLRAGCVFPFVTSVRLEDIAATTMLDRPSEQIPVTAVSILRQAFYIERDWQKCRAQLDAIDPPRPLNELEEIISRLVGYALFGNYGDV